jgi:hypothetical protein
MDLECVEGDEPFGTHAAVIHHVLLGVTLADVSEQNISE